MKAAPLFFILTCTSILFLYAEELLCFSKLLHSNQQPLGFGHAEEFKLPKDMRLTVLSSNPPQHLPFIFFLSGDGGWTKFDQRLAESLANEGFSIIGLDSKVYFWSAKTPDNTATEVSSLIKHYQSLWNKEDFVLIGYSFGADIIPFLANRLNPPLKRALRGVLALSPDHYTDFEVRLTTLLNLRKSTKFDVLSEFKKIKTVTPVVFFGSKEDFQLRNLYINQGLVTQIINGNHHFNFDYPTIVKNITGKINQK